MNISNEIAFIDRSITDLETFLAGLRPNIEPIILDAEASAPAQIAKALYYYSDRECRHTDGYEYKSDPA